MSRMSGQKAAQNIGNIGRRIPLMFILEATESDFVPRVAMTSADLLWMMILLSTIVRRFQKPRRAHQVCS